MFGNEEEERSDSTQSRDAKQAKRSTKARTIRRTAAIRAESIEKKILLSRTPQEIHHPSTGFHTPRLPRLRGRRLTRCVRQITLKSSMHSRILPVARRTGVACLCGAGVCRVGHAVPRVPQRRHRDRQLRRVRARRRSLVFSMPIGAVDASACRRSEPARRQPAGVGGQLDRDREIRRVRAAHALHGEQRRVRLRGAGRRRRGDAERDRAGQGREGAAEAWRSMPGAASRRGRETIMDTAPTTCAEMLGLLDEAISGLRACCWRNELRHRSRRDGAAARIRAIRCRCSERRRPPKPSRTRLPRRRPPTSPSIAFRFFAASSPRSTIRETRCPRPGRAPTRRWAAPHDRRRSADRENVRRVDHPTR